MKAPAIPRVQRDEAVMPAVRALIENVEVLKGRRPGQDKILRLPAGASTADIVERLNEIIDRLNS